jgi:signal transduction histidine kinase
MVYFILALMMILVIICVILLIAFNMQIRKLNYCLQLIIDDFSQMRLKTETRNPALNEFIAGINSLIEKYTLVQSQNENNRKQYQKLISSIAHDFKTPATSILGYIELAESEEDERKKKEYLDVIRKRLENLTALIDDFFILSVLESNDYPYHFEEVNPKSILQEQLAVYYDHLCLEFPDIEVKLESYPIYITADRQAMVRIFNNLIKNALEYGSHVLSVEERISDTFYCIQITNNKSGDCISKKKVSTGLGLNIIKRFARDLELIFTIKESEEKFTAELTFQTPRKLSGFHISKDDNRN